LRSSFFLVTSERKKISLQKLCTILLRKYGKPEQGIWKLMQRYTPDIHQGPAGEIKITCDTPADMLKRMLPAFSS